jgi:hypothetical protein
MGGICFGCECKKLHLEAAVRHLTAEAQRHGESGCMRGLRLAERPALMTVPISLQAPTYQESDDGTGDGACEFAYDIFYRALCAYRISQERQDPCPDKILGFIRHQR